ncbi:MAG: hypothetical protein QOH06_2744 [Acidobacteriota bacterium]|nr:hypothetical protein [Acidobacteriota bacterium]
MAICMAIDCSIFVRPASRLLAASGLALLFACSQQAAVSPAGAPPAPASKGSSQDNSAPAKPGFGEADPSSMELPKIEPPDGKWLSDEKGRQYFIEEVPKVEGWYIWLNEEKTQVRLWHGMVFDAVDSDEDSIRIKIYKVEPGAPEVGPAPGLTAADKEKIAAGYSNQTGKADRLTFEPFGRGLPSRGQWRNGFKIADMNGDGNPDIVHGPARKGQAQPNIFLGDGKGGWQRWAEVSFPRLAYDYGDVAVADFNGDRRLDLALAIHLRGVIVLVADGPATFKEWSKGIDFQVPGQGADEGGFSSRTIEAADWNGDGRPDLISLGEGPRMATAPTVAGRRPAGSKSFGVLVYLNQGDGSWTRQDEKSRLFGEDLAVADFTNDGQLDIVLGSSVLGDRDILRIGGSADGSDGVAGGSWTSVPLAELRPRSYVGAVEAADFNGDRRTDLVLGFLTREGDMWRTGIDVLLARAEGGWERKGVAVEENRDWLTALDSGDLDGDGRLDLAATTGDGEVWIFLGKGDGSFLREESPEVPPSKGGCRGYDIQIVNLDADPVEEIVVEFAGEPSAMFAPMLCTDEGSLTAWKPRARK